MRRLGLLLSLILFMAAARAQTPESMKLQVVAIHALTQNAGGAKIFDRELDGVKDALEDLNFDTFKHLSSNTLSVDQSGEASCRLDSRYTLFVKALPKEAQGQPRLSVRVEMAAKEPGGKPVNAVSMVVAPRPGKKLMLRGLKADDGELVVVLTLKQA